MTAILVALLTLVSTVGSSEGPVEWTAYLRRLGPIRLGMSVEDARRALRETGQPRTVAPATGCSYWSSGALPKGVAVMLHDGRVVRIDVSETGIATASGVRVGDTEASVKAAYPGRIEVSPHKYDKQGHYLRFVSRDRADQDVGMVFETDGRRVTTFRVGTVEAVGLVERCG